MILEAIINADYNKSVERFNNEHIEEGSIIFLGDSFVSGYQINKYFTNENIVNRGIAGDTAEKVLKRLEQIIKIKPSVVIINVGSNDIVRTKNSVEEIAKDILNIKNILEYNIENVKVYVLTLPPVLRDHKITQKSYMKHRTNDIIDKINDKLSFDIELLNTKDALKDNDNNLRLDYTKDGLHLNDLGYKVFSKVLSEKIKVLKLK